MIVIVGVGANDGLMSCKMLAAELFTGSLGAVNSQPILNAVAWVKADYVVVGFDVATTAVFAVLEI